MTRAASINAMRLRLKPSRYFALAAIVVALMGKAIFWLDPAYQMYETDKIVFDPLAMAALGSIVLLTCAIWLWLVGA